MTMRVPFSLSNIRRQAVANYALYAAGAYALLSVIGALILLLPASREADAAALSFLDALFIATSAVSTTGLVVVDPGSTFTFFGEVVVLLLIQIGGIGYLTLVSFAFLTIRDKLSVEQIELTRAGFGLTSEYSIGRFVRIAVVSALVIEVIGAIMLSLLFARAGVEDAVWQGIFHSISAFCTAGFSLFANSLEEFSDQPAVLLAVSLLCYIGAIGFVVIAEVVDVVSRPRTSLSPTTRIILLVTLGTAVFGTVFLLLFEPGISALPSDQRLVNAFFQAMTASTTVGFNSISIGAIAPATIMVLFFLMFVGASPSGTGGGLKSTTVALLVATVISALRGRPDVRTAGVSVPEARVRQASATFIVGILMIFVSVTLLDLTGSYPFDQVLFEVFSALGTVGLSMGITAQLNEAGKAIVILVMYIGRVGILLFFLAFAARLGEDLKKPVRERDIMI